MPRKRYSTEQIIRMLREAEVLQEQGLGTPEIAQQLGIGVSMFYRWRKEYGGLRIDQARRLKELEKENSRLKKLVADISIDNQILKEVASGNF